MNKSQLKQLIREEVRSMMGNGTSGNLLAFVKNNKEDIASLKPDFSKVIMDNDVDKLSLDYWSSSDFDSAYEKQGYTYDEFKKDWQKHNPEVIMLGSELSTVFITDKKLPTYFANTLSGNDTVFFGTTMNKNNAFGQYEVNGRTLYIVWGIPDPGS